MSSAAKPRYRLTKAEEGQRVACAFFSLPQGCRNGKKCAFLHVAGEVAVDGPSGSADAHAPVEVKPEFPGARVALCACWVAWR